MENPIIIALIGACAGLVSGTIASIIAPWVNWGIEKRKLKRDEKRELISSVRDIIMKVYEEQEEINKKLSYGTIENIEELKYPKSKSYLDALQHYKCFHKIKPFLSENLINRLYTLQLYKLEDRGTDLGSMPLPLQEVMQEISFIENKWKLN